MALLEELRITPENRDDFLKSSLSERQVRLIHLRLNDAELRAIDDTEGVEPIDYFHISKARRLIARHPALAERISKTYRVKEEDKAYFFEGKERWIKHELELLKLKGSFSQKELTNKLLTDFDSNHNGLAYKLYFCFKHREKIERCPK